MILQRHFLKLVRALCVSVGLVILLYPRAVRAVTLLTQVQSVNINPTINTNYNYSSFLKFDTRLGTLRTVTLKLNWLSLGGSFTFSQMSSGSSTITAFNVDTIFYAASSLNNTAHNGLISDFDVGTLPKTGSLTVTNQTLPKSITRSRAATFNFDTNSNLLASPIDLLNLSTTEDLTFYSGTGISFAPAFTSITKFMITGTFLGNPVTDYSKLTQTLGMSLYYDYIPPAIPEPNYCGFFMGVTAFVFGVGRCVLIRASHSKSN